jgi:hypothetical protein
MADHRSKYDKLEGKADAFLARVGALKFTAAILIVCAVLAVIVVFVF